LDQLAGKGLSAAVIVELVTLNLAWMLVLAVPMGVLVATLMAFGSMASNNEITAMRASGISLYRMMAPVFIVSILICYLLIRFNNDVLPDANHHVRVLQTDISRKKPTLTLVPGMFTQLLQGHSILVRKTFEHSNDLEGVTILDYSQPMLTATITAHHGTISFSSDYQKLIMDLWNGEIHQINNQLHKQYRIVRFKKHRIVMEAEGFNFQRSQEGAFTRGDRELSASAMVAMVDSLHKLQNQSIQRTQTLLKKNIASLYSPGPDQPILGFAPSNEASQFIQVRQAIENDLLQNHYYNVEAKKYLVEIHKKYAIPVACIVFIFIGAPLGIMARKGTFGIGASLSLGFFVLYWACLKAGENLADRELIEPWMGMWMGNILLGVVGIYLTIRTARETPTITWFDLARFLPKSWRSNPGDAEKS
jgi:lipopolysaccharide export system permease protein